MNFRPENDGVDHVNVYSRGRTELGRLLSNFAHTPFELDGLEFASVEAWWYWRNAAAMSPADDQLLRSSYGFRAKEVGRALRCTFPAEPTREQLRLVYEAKARQNELVRMMLAGNDLPYTHYYVHDGVQRLTRHQWTGELWNEVKP